MSVVNIPFRWHFKTSMLGRSKVMTVRPRRMGRPGDVFAAFHGQFRLTHVMRMRLGYVASDCFIQEGCEKRQEFIAIYKAIHPAKGFDPDEIVWAHCFTRIA